jgi:large subunit ribosomal protein L25
MEEVALVADAGRPTGSAAARRLRAVGKVPAVLYGHGIDPQALAVGHRELRTALNSEAGRNALISLDVGGTRHLAMARQLQRHPTRGSVDHVDFVIVRRDEVVAAEVPVHLVGEAVEVDRADGLVAQQLFSLVVHSTPGNIPHAIEVDISGLTIGESIRVGDIALLPGVTTEVDAEEAIVVAQASRVAAALDEEAAEAAEAAEGAEGAAEAGAPSPAGEGQEG